MVSSRSTTTPSPSTGHALNVANRTVFTGDNLDVLRGFNSDAVDLIYLDPPFNSNRTYEAPVGSEAAGAAFKDTWTLSDVDVCEIGLLSRTDEPLADFIRAAGQVSGPSMMSYLTMMATRLIEMRRVLKPEGSIYLHCDPTASHYLKVLMDSVFGGKSFRNEIVWKRTGARSEAKQFGRVHDIILFYAGEAATWNAQWLPHDPAYVERSYNQEDELGRWQPVSLTAPDTSDGESGALWRGVDPTDKGRHWALPVKGGMAEFIKEQELIPGWPDHYEGIHARLDALDEAGLIYWPPEGGVPRLKWYLTASRGVAATDVIVDIHKLEAASKEKVGYPTQKPLKLLERIIRASSDPGDLVLDPFCGCATACVAAETLGRQWVGIDLSVKAVELTRHRLRDQHGIFGQVIDRDDIPARTDLGKIPNYRTWKDLLYGQQQGDCAGCGVHFPHRNLTIDHKIPRGKGGQDNLENLQLLCGACNSTKGTGSQAELLAKLGEQTAPPKRRP